MLSILCVSCCSSIIYSILDSKLYINGDDKYDIWLTSRIPRENNNIEMQKAVLHLNIVSFSGWYVH